MAGGVGKVEPRHSSPVPSLPPTLQRVLPRTLPGPVSPQNKGALDWGWQGFLAYGAQTTVVVVDPVTLQCAQTLSKHRSHIVKVRWRKTRHYHQLSAPYTLVLASADSGGSIVVWDVVRGEALATLQDGTKPVLELEWLGGVDGSEHLLAALHPPYSLVLWDTRHSTKVWRKSYTEPLTAFHFDPFHASKMAFLCSGCVLFVEDFNLIKCPSSNGRKFYVSAPRTSPGRGGAGQGSSAAPPGPSAPPGTGGGAGGSLDERTSSRIRRKMRELVVGEVKPSTRGEESSQLVECVQLAYHRTVRDQLLLLYAREILILDLNINQTVGIVAVDRAVSPFCQVLSCWRRDVLLCLHESGSVSAHFRRRLLPIGPTSPDESGGGGVEQQQQYYEVMYDRKCHSEPLRLNRLSRAIGFTLDPVTERQIALVLGDGRVVFKQLQVSPTPGKQTISTPLFTPGHPTPPVAPPQASQTQSGLTITDDHFGGLAGAGGVVGGAGVSQSAPLLPKMSLGDLVKPAWALTENVKDTPSASHRITLRLIMTGLMPSVSPPPLVVRMCPPLTTRNMHHYVPRLAAGTQSGAVQVFNMATGMLEREFALHTYPVRGVEWASLSSILSFGHQPLTNTQGLVRNELTYTDILTGRSTPLRSNKGEESSIDMVRVSYLKQYFLVVLREEPLELWDARRLVPLRTMPRRFPRVSALEWSPTSHVKARLTSEGAEGAAGAGKDVMGDSTLSLVDVGTTTAATTTASTTTTTTTTTSIAKETFVFTDTEGQLYHFSVEGNVIKDGSKVPPDSQMSSITSIAWKSHEIVLSDADGNLTVWDLKTRISRHIATHRGWVRKVRFAPGRDNMKLLVLFADGLDVWDVRDVVLVSQVKTPRDMVKVVDADWGASDRPVLATVDGCLRVMDMAMRASNSPLHTYCTKEAIVSPYLLSGEASLNLRTLLTHQPWRPQYTLVFSTDDGFTPDQLQCIDVWLSRIPKEVREYLEQCDSTAHRALVTAQLFGDQGELDFWTVASHYLAHPPLPAAKDESSSSSSSVGSAELLTFGESASVSGEDMPCPPCPQSASTLAPPATSTPSLPPTHPLETTYHYLCDAATYKHHELERLAIHESKGLEGEQRIALGRSLAMVGERDRAVRLLLDADASHTHFYTDCLRACLLSATHHSPQAQSTIKLVATNLIAAGNVSEGVELLCLIGKAGDACRYLQSYGQWLSSVWLAKCALPVSESVDILKRWAHHLITTGSKDQGVCVLLSVGSMTSAVEQLVQQHYHQRAALFLSAATHLHTATPPPPPPPQPPHPQPQPASSFNSSFSPILSSSSSSLASLTENIHRKYVLHLYSLGNRPAVAHFCRLLGEKGQVLLQELEALQ